MSHVVVAIFVGCSRPPAVPHAPARAHVAARAPDRRRRRRAHRGLVAAAHRAPRHDAEHAVRRRSSRPASWKLPGLGRDPAAGPGRSTRSKGIVRGARRPRPTRPARSIKQPLWLPWWIWLLAGVAIVAAGWYRRRSTLVLAHRRVRARRALRPMARARGVEHAVPAVLAADLGLHRGDGRDRDPALDRAAGAGWRCAGSATATSTTRAPRRGSTLAAEYGDGTPPDTEATEVVAAPRLAAGAARHGIRPTQLRPRERRPSRPGACRPSSMAVLVAVIGIWSVNRAWEARNDNPSIAIQAWARVELHGLREQAGVAGVLRDHGDDGRAAARDARCGNRRHGRRRTRSTPTARRSRSSCCRTGPRAASVRWKASTSSRRPPRRSTSSR